MRRVGDRFGEDHEVVRDGVTDLVHQPRRADRRRVPVLLRVFPVPRSGRSGSRPDLFRARRRSTLLIRRLMPAHLLRELGERGLRVREERQVGCQVLADLPRVHVDLHELRLRRDRALRVGKDQLENRRADDQQQVARLEHLLQRPGRDEVHGAEVQRMLRGRRELGGVALEDRHAGHLRERDDFRLGVGERDAVADHQ